MLLCARNETCSFQVVLTASGEDCAGAVVDVSDLARGTARISASRVTLYRQEFLHVFYRSSAQGELGEWPDALIPNVDPEYGERRNAFPFDLRRVSRAYRLYAARRGRPVVGVHGSGSVQPGGEYTGGLARRYVVRIVKPGAVGVATYVWRSEPGPAQASLPRATSHVPVQLKHGVNIAFRGQLRDDDFLAGDEFWFYAGPQRHQPVWVDVDIPADAQPGVYSAQVRVKLAGGAELLLPLRLEVLDFALPSTGTLATYFGIFGHAVRAAHLGPAEGEPISLELWRAYALAAVRNRVTIDAAFDFAPAYEFRPDGSIDKADYSRYDAAVSPFLDGKGTPRGTRWTSLRVPGFEKLSDAELQSALRDFAGHARERGWFERLFHYTFDEPKRDAKDLAVVRKRAEQVRAADAQIPRLVTTELEESLFGLVTRWCPVVNALEPRSRFLHEWWENRKRPRRSDYEARLQAGDSLWWYQSCQSHDCGGAGPSPWLDNWPSYMVDVSAVANRVFGLLSAVTYKVSGILYWDVAYAHHSALEQATRDPDPWESVYYFGGNGDGTLFYPGRPDRIGGNHHIAIESLRLKMIRDSLYDAELASTLRRLGEEEFLQREVRGVVQSAYRWNPDPQAWDQLRRTLLRRIAEHTSGKPASR